MARPVWHPAVPYRNSVQTKYGKRVVMSGHKCVDRLVALSKENRLDFDTMSGFYYPWANLAGETDMLCLLVGSSLSTGRHL